jgi:hypothetical protein
MKNLTIKTRIKPFVQSAAVLISLLGFAAVPAAAQKADPGFALVTGHWSRGAADSIAWVDLATWKLVTRIDDHPSLDPQPQPWLPVAGDWDGDGVDTVQMFNVHDWRLVPLDRGPVTGESADPQPQPWLPVAGDWDGRGIDTVLVFDQRDGTTHRLEEGPLNVVGYDPQPQPWRPLAGHWESLEKESIASYKDSASAPDTQRNWGTVAGNWDGSRIDTLGFVHLPTGTLVLPEAITTAPALKSGMTGGKRIAAPFFDKDNQPGSGCYTTIKDYGSVAKIFKYSVGGCMILVIESWWEWNCCPITSGQPAYYGCSKAFKTKVHSYGYSNC